MSYSIFLSGLFFMPHPVYTIVHWCVAVPFISDRPDIRPKSRVCHTRLHSTPPLILIVFSRLDRGIQSATEILPLKRGRGVAHSFNCTPRVCRICVLLTHLFIYCSRFVNHHHSRFCKRRPIISVFVIVAVTEISLPYRTAGTSTPWHSLLYRWRRCLVDEIINFLYSFLRNSHRRRSNGKGLDTCYSAIYMSQTRDQQRFTISEVAAYWHEPIVPQRII